MKTIREFHVQILNGQAIPLDDEAVVLSVGINPIGHICIWAIIDLERKATLRRVVILGSGQVFPDQIQWNFIGSITVGAYVWHVFYEGMDGKATFSNNPQVVDS